jgi:hypothetical protein
LDAAELSKDVKGSSAADPNALNEKPFNNPGSVTAAGKPVLKKLRLFIGLLNFVSSAQMILWQIGDEFEHLY